MEKLSGLNYWINNNILYFEEISKRKAKNGFLTVSANRDRICWKDEVLSACFIIKASVAWIQCKTSEKESNHHDMVELKNLDNDKEKKKSKRWKRSAEHSRPSTSYYLLFFLKYFCDVTEDFPTAQLCCILKFYRLNWKVVIKPELSNEILRWVETPRLFFPTNVRGRKKKRKKDTHQCYKGKLCFWYASVVTVIFPHFFPLLNCRSSRTDS